jgi:hypothetical protein
MTTLKTTGRLSRAIIELQEAFTRGTPLRGEDAPAYQGPRGTLLRSGRRGTSATGQTIESVPRWR